MFNPSSEFFALNDGYYRIVFSHNPDDSKISCVSARGLGIGQLAHGYSLCIGAVLGKVTKTSQMHLAYSRYQLVAPLEKLYTVGQSIALIWWHAYR